MPCYRCQRRQDDPARGASPWKRGVLAGEQVLICPECQRGRDWTAELDRCASCGSSALVRTLGETICRSCGTSGTPTGSRSSARAPHESTSPEQGALAEQVRAALDRVLRRDRP